MSKTYKKKDKDTLEVTSTQEPTVTTEDRAEIQTQVDHWEQDLVDIQEKINDANVKLTVFDG